ncbi:MAG TPA: hypothetical protein VNZ50_11415 [Hyphomicrobiaceae bacterium]|jgi:hypothetical protein|nr:hypothetical protein [Hyphomicrobiaceae bacterium]
MFRIASAVALLLTLMIAPAAAQRGPGGDRWVTLGEQKVGFMVDRDVLRLNQNEDWFRREGPFSDLRLTAERNDIHIMNVRVVYLNGFAEDFRVDGTIRRGQSVNIDLRGERSFLRQIEFIYRSKLSLKGEARLRVDARVARRGPPGPPDAGPRVELLGSQKIGFSVDRDVLRVGRREGRFSRIALRALDNDIEIMDMKIFYGGRSGRPDDVQFRGILRAGQRTQPIDLRGNDPRVIDRIEFVYRARPNFRGAATLEVYGVH